MTEQVFIVTITADFTMPAMTVETIFRDWAARNNQMGLPMYMESVKVEEKGKQS